MSSLFSITDAVTPGVAVEIGAGRISGAVVERRGRQAVIGSHAVEPLPAGALVPSLTAANVIDRATVMTALNRVIERVGRPSRLALVIPDIVARVSLVRFEKVPARTGDLDQLIRWQVRKAAPFPLEEAQISYARGIRSDEGQEFVVTVARHAVIEEYEALCTEAGAHAGLVDLSTIGVINALLAGGAATAGDWLVINIAADSASIAIMRGTDLIFFRNRPAEAEASALELMHQTAVYYEDRLQGTGFSRAFVAGTSYAGADADSVRHGIEERIGTAIETVDPRQVATMTDRITAAPALLDAMTPLVGLLLRDEPEGARA
jgi:Tfp pilus assembly PilM family ATPase